MPNRLAAETSPYLLQHAGNPVDWYPWGPEALERARAEDRPILLSIGYSACHWCHVMAHESFEDPAIAAQMNRDFVNIKVDREERPDLDQIYQAAHQLFGRGAGGWPLTMFLSPDGTPFLGGTYFPPAPRHGLPGFGEVLAHVAKVWREKRDAIAEQDVQLREAFSRLEPAAGAHRSELARAPIDGLLETLRAGFDARHGGFGGAPKFPHPTDLAFCLRHGETAIAGTTLARMCEGGIYDQLGGGFCRYSVDAHWTIPHFEKMLYDNGQLLALLADAWRVSREPLFERCAAESAAWLMGEMQSAEGGYYSSLDADSEHEEGKFYVWQRDEIRALLTPEEYAAIEAHFGLDRAPNFENRHWHLRIAAPCADPERLGTAKHKLRAARAHRVPPARDEKILASWNALAILGMARAGRVFGREDWIDSARRSLTFVRTRMWRDGRLLATARGDRAHLAAYLDDYAFLIAAVLELLQAGFEPAELEFAESLADVLLDQFEDPAAGGFYFTAREHEKLLHRPKPGPDGATPSGNGTAAWALNRLAAVTGEDRYARAAERVLELFYPAMRERPAGYAQLALALAEWHEPPAVLVLRGAPDEARRWAAALARENLPETLVFAPAPGLEGLPPALEKPDAPGTVNGWLCHGVTCLPPIGDLQELIGACKGVALR